jgi:hypothetical protein
MLLNVLKRQNEPCRTSCRLSDAIAVAIYALGKLRRPMIVADFRCGHAGNHRPVLCRVVKLWEKKCADDSETSNWLQANTKECQKCQSTIEKNGGCK